MHVIRQNSMNYRAVIFICIFIFAVGIRRQVVSAAQTNQPEIEENTDPFDAYDFEEINTAAKQAGYQGDFRHLIWMVLENQDKGLFASLWQQMMVTIQQTWSMYKKMTIQILVLVLFSAVLVLFAPQMHQNQISDMAQMIVGMSLLGLVIGVFFEEMTQCIQILEQMKAVYLSILPVFFSAVLVATGTIGVAVYQEMIAICLQVVTVIFEKIFVRVNQIGLLLSLADCVSDKPHFTRAEQSIYTGIRYGCRVVFFLFSGLAGIRGMGAPLAEAVKKNLFFKSLQAIPVVGDSVESITQVITGGSAIVRNGIGMAAICLMVVTTILPFLKMMVIMVLFRILAVVAEPVADKRFVKILTSVSTAIGLFAGIILTTVMLFVMFIICICRNFP